MQPKKIALLAKELVLDKQAEDPVILDISKLSSVANYFVICHGNSERQVKAISDHVVETMKKHKEKPLHVEGTKEAQWILVDFGAVIVHIFYHETREFYGLERLWGDAPKVTR